MVRSVEVSARIYCWDVRFGSDAGILELAEEDLGWYIVEVPVAVVGGAGSLNVASGVWLGLPRAPSPRSALSRG